MAVGAGVSSFSFRMRAGLMLLALLLLAGVVAQPAAAKKKSGSTPHVTIRTTEYGIPRILADNLTGLGYGYGYAIAKEQICTLADAYVTSRGERSLYFGGDASAPDGNSNLDSDFFWKKVRAEGTVARLLKAKPPQGPNDGVKKVMAGYVRGYNRWLKDTGVNRISDPRCRGAKWVKPITVLDAWHRMYQLDLIASQGASLDGIAEAQPPVTQMSAGAQPDQAVTADDITPAQIKALNDRDVGGLGSNAIGLGSQGTKSGHGLLLGNPHFPWVGSERFFESQMTIPGKVNVSGASLNGVPVILIGHTRNMAWSHTVSTARRFFFYKEQLVPGDPTSYVVDGKTYKMKATPVSVKVKGADGNITTQTRTLYSTIHGPISNSVQGQPLLAWTNSTAYSMGDSNDDSFRIANHFFAINQAQSTKQVLSILKKYQGLPWVNTIASDSKGNALYADIGSVPDITNELVSTCNTGIGNLLWPVARVAVMDGSRADCQVTKKEPGAAAPGILPPSRQPYMFRKDYVENSNDSYWLSNIHKPLEGFDRIIGEERIAQSERTRLAEKMVNEGLANGGKFTLEKLKKLEFNNRVGSAELLLKPMIDFCTASPIMTGTGGPVDVSAGCAALKGWDGRNNLDSTGGLLFQRFIGRAFSSANPVYSNPFDYTDPIGTPSGLNTANPDIAKAFADTVTEFTSQGIPLTAKRRDYQYVTRNGKKIPIPGGDYEPYGSFNAAYGPWVPGKGIPEVIDGSSFIIAADLNGTKCPRVNTILSYSQSENPKSKHYADQTRLFSKGKWVTDRFCPGQQKKSPGLKVKKFGGGAKAAKKGF